MTKIRELFDSNRNLERQIEKVISYGAGQESRLKAEISEYVVTENIEEQMHDLLSKMQDAMDSGESTEVGVWVSGFYGSGKSSFTKYLALALDESITIDGEPFLKHFQNRFQRSQTKQALSTFATRFPAAVVMLDLATESIAGSALAPVTDVLYYKVLQLAGFSRFLKVTAFEKKLHADGRYEEFLALCEEQVGVPWLDFQNDELAIESLLSGLAHSMYPDLFNAEQSFTSSSIETIDLHKDRVEEIVEIVRRHTGKEHVVFVIDEVGQYVGANQNKILDLQGFSENIKNLGDGKVWAICTAQQTLTEDDQRMALNSPELFKLKDRFPISVDLESHDIREICYRRLLAKSISGGDTLATLFSQHGQALRHNTKLEDARYYDAELNEEDFKNLYPFLPAHFDILLHLLGALAKSTGGVGLRSAIKVVQDILIERKGQESAVADNPVGWLATTVTLYDALEKDIERAFLPIHQSIGKALIRFPDSDIHKNVAKTIGILQILGNLPVTISNVTALMHPGVETSSQAEKVKTAVDELIGDSYVPLGIQDNCLSFFSEKLNDIGQKRVGLTLRQADLRRIGNEALRELYDPLPKASLNGAMTVKSGLKAQSGAGSPASIAGERDPIQTIVELVDPGEYDDRRKELVEESRQRSSRAIIYLLGRKVPDLDEKLAEIYRCRRIAENYRSDPDQEVKDYCASQLELGKRLLGDFQAKMKRALGGGSFIFGGQHTSVDSLDSDLLAASKKQLLKAAEEVFNKNGLAPERVDTTIAEKFLRQSGNLTSISKQIDPMGLVKVMGSAPSVDTNVQALVEIRDYIDRNGTVEGRRLSEDFSRDPYGWSQDTLRYMVAALLVAGEVKLRISGREVTTAAQQAIDALKTNNTFKSVGVALRDDRPSNEVLARAANRLTDLSGERVLPLEQKISEEAVTFLQGFQVELGLLAEQLDQLSLPGADDMHSASREVADILQTDASDAPQRFGGEESALADSLDWAKEVKRALKQGLKKTITDLRKYKKVITELPGSGLPGDLVEATRDAFKSLEERLERDDFHKDMVPYNTVITELDGQIAGTVGKLREAQSKRTQLAEQDLRRIPEWNEFNEAEHGNVLDELGSMIIEVNDDLNGLQSLIRHEFDLGQKIDELKRRIEEEGKERQRKRIHGQGKRKAEKSASIPSVITLQSELDALIQRLQSLSSELSFYDEFELTLTSDE